MKRARRGVQCDDRKVFWFRLCEKGQLAKASIDIIFIILSLTIFGLFVLLESYYWRCLSCFSHFAAILRPCCDVFSADRSR
jgi:hypothetical protein